MMLCKQEKYTLIHFPCRTVRKVLLKATALHDSCIVGITKKMIEIITKKYKQTMRIQLTSELPCIVTINKKLNINNVSILYTCAILLIIMGGVWQNLNYAPFQHRVMCCENYFVFSFE